MKEETTKKIAEVTADLLAKALLLLPKTITYRVGDKCKTFELRIKANKDGWEAYYFDNNLSTLNLDREIYMCKAENGARAIFALYEKVLRNGDLHQECYVRQHCEGCPNETEDCVKIHNADNTTTCINPNKRRHENE